MDRSSDGRDKPVLALHKNYEKLMEKVDEYIAAGSVLVSLNHRLCKRPSYSWNKGDVYSEFDMVLAHPQ